MLILLDLDGTLTNTVHPTWKPYKDGTYPINADQVPLIPGAAEFISSRKAKGDDLVIVSDSHPKYVGPLARRLGLEWLSLADKPNAGKTKDFLSKNGRYVQMLSEHRCYIIGDTRLDIELGRRLGAYTIWFVPYQETDDIKDPRDGICDDRGSIKAGPTFTVPSKTFAEVEEILDAPEGHLYAVEGAFAGMATTHGLPFWEVLRSDHTFAHFSCLARQEQGLCDAYARADIYHLISSATRSKEMLQTLAKGVAAYIYGQLSQGSAWDCLTYIADKETTQPPNKMKEIFDLVDVPVRKAPLLHWSLETDGSTRQQPDYNARKEFLSKYLTLAVPPDIAVKGDRPLEGKNIIVLDDQLTTGQTAWHVCRLLREKGAGNILFIAFFLMVTDVEEGILCPHCGKPMRIKIRKADGHKFYSCTPPQYGGEGCGYIMDIKQ